MPLQLDPITLEEYVRIAWGNPDYSHLKIRDYHNWRLYLHPNQTYLYRCYIWLLGEHSDLQQRYQLDAVQDGELAAISWSVHAALGQLSRPDMVNELYAGNEYCLHRGHAHLHLIPRYYDPPSFNGREFPDERFGKNHAPYPAFVLEAGILEAIRISLASALAKLE